MSKTRKLAAVGLFLVIIVFIIIYIENSPVTFRLSLQKELTPKIISVNGVPTNSFSFKRFYGEKPYRDANLTIVVEVLYNHYKPVNGAIVTLYGYGGIDTNKTNKEGIATLHLHIHPFWNHDTPEGYLSMIVIKGKYIEIIDKSVRLTHE
ncbi:MAG: hypothetical protein J7J36_00790 [Thermoplasmata archaeon]|nr:hypothetical protein [Thermoplasmata archaeon]